jgi:hypothetical protein
MPVPVTVTVVPAVPDDGVTTSVGVSARVDVNGKANADATMIIVAVAAQSRQRDGAGSWRGEVSGTQRVPSQNDMVGLHSATRLTQGVPWLCGPASRRVCHFVEAGCPTRSAV